MIKFNELQINRWTDMIASIGEYRSSKISFFDLVSDLAGAFQNGEYDNEDLVESGLSIGEN